MTAILPQREATRRACAILAKSMRMWRRKYRKKRLLYGAAHPAARAGACSGGGCSPGFAGALEATGGACWGGLLPASSWREGA